MARENAADGTNGFRTALAVEAPLVLLASSTVGLRVYSRIAIKKKLALDDVLIILGTAAAFARTVISCMSADDNGGPDHASEIPYYQHIFERRIAYLLAVTLTRLSILAYYLRIFPSGLTSLRRGSGVSIAITLTHFCGVLAVLTFHCQDIGKLWSKNWTTFTGSKCFSSGAYSYSAAIGDSAIDGMIFALPLPYVWRLSKLRARQRCGLVLVFGLGFVVCVVALLQIPFIKRREDNMRYFGGAVNILIAIQISFAIVAASLPDLRALVARNFPNFSPLHHRSQVIADAHDSEEGGTRQPEVCIVEHDPVVHEPARHSRNAFEGKRVYRKPDWLRDSIPKSLLSTGIIHSETARCSQDDIPNVHCLPKQPEKAATR